LAAKTIPDTPYPKWYKVASEESTFGLHENSEPVGPDGAFWLELDAADLTTGGWIRLNVRLENPAIPFFYAAVTVATDSPFIELQDPDKFPRGLGARIWSGPLYTTTETSLEENPPPEGVFWIREFYAEINHETHGPGGEYLELAQFLFYLTGDYDGQPITFRIVSDEHADSYLTAVGGYSVKPTFTWPVTVSGD
jgi:hypothetical protein